MARSQGVVSLREAEEMGPSLSPQPLILTNLLIPLNLQIRVNFQIWVIVVNLMIVVNTLIPKKSVYSVEFLCIGDFFLHRHPSEFGDETYNSGESNHCGDSDGFCGSDESD